VCVSPASRLWSGAGWGAIAWAVLLTVPRLASAAPVGEYAGDLTASERIVWRQASLRSAEGAALFSRGEEALVAGDLRAAEVLFRQSRDRMPDDGLPARRHCQVLAELGRRDEAIAACKIAVSRSATGRDLRAMVGALMSGKQALSSDDVAEALSISSGVIREQIGGHAARCDIALRLGDRAMANRCLAGLARLAPDHYETRRVRRALPGSSHAGAWIFWSLLGLCGLGTLAHLAGGLGVGWGKGARKRPLAAAALLLAVSAVAGAGPARADSFPTLPNGFPVDDADPSSNIPSEEARNRKPIQFGYFLQELLERGEKAMKAKRPLDAARYYAAVAKATPDKAAGYSRMCAAYEEAGDRKRGLAACNFAMSREGARVDDSARYYRLMMRKEGALTPDEVKDLKEVFEHLLEADDVSRMFGLQMQCDLALQISDLPLLESCTSALAVLAPKNPRTVTFQWSLAVRKGDRPLAQQLVQRGRALGIKDEGIAKMEQATAAMSAAHLSPRWRWPLLGLGTACLAGAAALLLSRRRAAAAARA
jgi:tetratricopeptide (TPR) repeat protein